MDRVALDTTAWFEVFAENPAGRKLSTEFLDKPNVKVLTPSLALAEMSAKLARRGLADRIAVTLSAMDSGSEVVHLSTTAAMACGPLLVELRKADENASLVDAIMLATARDQDAKLISNDPAFKDQPDVITF
ncbi:MAG: PIN domain-containing protein [Thermoplasmatota archaeon]